MASPHSSTESDRPRVASTPMSFVSGGESPDWTFEATERPATPPARELNSSLVPTDPSPGRDPTGPEGSSSASVGLSHPAKKMSQGISSLM
jgi:hypothetical protein